MHTGTVAYFGKPTSAYQFTQNTCVAMEAISSRVIWYCRLYLHKV